jgi:Arc/MetJ-type ribon-helix-helix transcriptional regulator
MKKSNTAVKRKYTTITIPTKLFEKMQERIKDTGFSSVSDYATYILRDTMAEMALSRQKGGKGTNSAVLEKLKALGYTN